MYTPFKKITKKWQHFEYYKINKLQSQEKNVKKCKFFYAKEYKDPKTYKKYIDVRNRKNRY